MIQISAPARLAAPEDQHQIANLMFFESHVHRHLDWRAPLEWLGSPFYWVMEDNGRRVVAVLACPQDPPGIAWIRLFAHASRISLEDAWSTLWELAEKQITNNGAATVAVISMHTWLSKVVAQSGFSHTQDIVMLEWDNIEAPVYALPEDVHMRAITPDDLQQVAELDADAFLPLWQNPLATLEKALPQASVATVAEDSRGLVGYQICTANPFGAHLARLAVRPDSQGRGLGSAIISDLILRLRRKGTKRLTVNTQSDNYASLALYQKLGFVSTGEQFPVYCYPISPEL